MNNPSPKNHVHRRVGEQVQKRIDFLKIGDKMQHLPEELWHESFRFYMSDPNRKGGPNMRIIRLDPQKPSLTVTGFVFNKFVHPFENRFITVREAARLQDFPDTIEFKGSLSSTQQQIGNAVPVRLAEAVLTAVTQSLVKANAVSDGGLSALSLFSGAGGFDLGAERVNYKGIGIQTVVCLDNWADACSTLRSYFGDRVQVIEQDISQINAPAAFFAEHTTQGVLPDLIYGGPPCQSFSQAGKQRGVVDQRGNLIFDFIRFVEELRPKAFVMENVSNIKGVEDGQLVHQINEKFDKAGYNTAAKILSAAEYGSPQTRRRMFFIGIRKDISTKPSFPAPTNAALPSLLEPPYKTVGEAFAELPDAKPHQEKTKPKALTNQT
jgi:DNA (cytosine-5)-methyltransferase 1